MKILINVAKGQVRERFFPDHVRAKIESAGEAVWNEFERGLTPEELRESLRGADAMLTAWGSPALTDFALEGADKLKLVAHTGGSVAGIMCGAAYDRGIKISSANELYGESVAEACVAYFLAALRDAVRMDARVRSGAWAVYGDKIDTLFGQTVGLVGLGTISRKLIALLKPFRCRLKVACDYAADEEISRLGAERATLEEVFSSCKIISVHLAQNPSTFRAISRGLLESMRDGTIFVNTSRGSCVDEEALIEVLQKNPSLRAALDVFETEPLPLNHKLAALGNAILSPHTAGLGVSLPSVTEKIFEDALGYLNGKPLRYEITREHAAYMTR